MGNAVMTNGIVGCGVLPDNWLPVFQALYDKLQQAARDKACCEVDLKVVVQHGGIRDKYIAVKSKIQ
jgi:hypothetical protein